MSYLGAPLNSVLTWGAQDISPGIGTRIIPPGYASGVLNINTPKGFRSPRAGVLRNFTVRHNRAVGNGASVVYTVRINNVDTPMTVTLATGVTISGVSSVQVVVASDDLIEVKRVVALALGNGEVEAICAAEFLGAQITGAQAL